MTSRFLPDEDRQAAQFAERFAEGDAEFTRTGVHAGDFVPNPVIEDIPSIGLGHGGGQRTPSPLAGIVGKIGDAKVFGNSVLQRLSTTLMVQDPSLLEDMKNGGDKTARVMRTIIDMFADDPAMYALFETSVRGANAMFQGEQAFLEALNADANNLQPPDPVEAIVRAAIETYEKRYGALSIAGRIFDESDVLRGAWEQASVRGSAVAPSPEAIAQAAATGVAPLVSPTDAVQVEVAGSALDVPITSMAELEVLESIEGRGAAWAVKDGQLVVKLSDSPDSPTWTQIVTLEDGHTIEDNADAVLAILQARAGTRHTLDPRSDDLPGGQAALGSIVENAGNVDRWFRRNWPQIHEAIGGAIDSTYNHVLMARPPGAEVDDGAREQAIRDNALGLIKAGTSRDVLAADLAIQLAMSGVEVNDSVTLAMGSVAEISEDEIASIRDSLINEVDPEQFIKQVSRIEDERTILGALFEDHVVPDAMRFLEQYEKVIYGIGIGLTDIASGIGPGGVPLDNPVTLVRNAWEEATTDQTFSEYLGLDPEADGWERILGGSLNFAAQIAFDPVTWLTPGGKAGFNAMIRALSDPAQSRAWLMGRTELQAWTRRLVTKNNRPQLVELLGSPELFQPDDLVRFIQIGATDFGDDVVRMSDVASEVFDILARNTPGGGGRWLPTGPQALQLRQSSLGWTRWWSDGSRTATNEQFSHMAALMVRADPQRSFSLGEEAWLGDNLRLLGQLYPTSGDDYAAAANVLIDAWNRYRGVDQVTQRGVIQMRVERIRQELDDMLRGVDIESVPVLRQHSDEVAAALRDAETQMVLTPDNADLATQVESLRNVANNYESLLDQLGPQFDELAPQREAIRNELFRLNAALDEVTQPGNRDILERTTQELFDDFAERVGVPTVDAPHPYIPGRKQRDWTVVTGGSPDETTVFVGQNLNTAPFGQYAKDWQAFSAPHATSSLLPVSPMQLLAYAAAPTDVWRKAVRFSRDVKLNTVLNKIGYAFSASVLINPVTPLKAHIDEILRFYQLTGQTGRSLNALVQFVPGVDRVGGAISRGITGSADEITEATGRQAEYVRELAGLVGNRDESFVLINPPRNKATQLLTQKHFDAAERWVNGTLVNQQTSPHFAAYARAIRAGGGDDTAAQAAFRQWFETEGHQLAQGVLPSGRVVDWQAAWDTISNGFDLVVGASKNSAVVRQRILEAAATGGRVQPEVLRWMGPVPGQVPSERGVFGRLFQAAFGGPGQRRGAVLYDYYQDVYRQTVIDPLTQRGRVITPQRLIDDFDMSLAEAEELLAHGRTNQFLRQYLQANNLYLAGDLESTAARWAAARSDDLMYSIGAASVFGRGSTRFYPYGRAQVDFLDYWWRQLTAPTQVRIGQNITDVKYVPLNLRMTNRAAKLGLFLDEDEQEQVGTPSWLAKTWTFFPTRWDESFIIDTVPSLGPLPIWAINWIPDDPEHPWYPLRRAVQEISPSAAIFGDYENDNFFGGIQNLVNNVMPTSGRSLRRQIGTIAGFAASQFGVGSPEDINRWYSLLVAASEPSYYRDNLALLTGEWLSQTDSNGVANAFSHNPGVEMENRARIAFDGMQEEAVQRAYSREATEQIRRSVGIPASYRSDNLYATMFGGLREIVQEWESLGWITPGMLENFEASAARVAAALDNGEAVDPEHLQEFANIASDIYNSDLVPYGEKARFGVLHAEVFANTASNFRVVPEFVPDEWADAVNGEDLVLPSGPARTEAFRKGIDEGWIVPRDVNEVFHDRHERAYRAASDLIKWIWEAPPGLGGMGQEWGDQSKAARQFIATFPSDWRFFEPLARMGVELPDEWRQPDGTYQVAGEELRDWLGDQRKEWNRGFSTETPDSVRTALSKLKETPLSDEVRAEAERRGWDIQWDETADVSYYGTQLVEDFEDMRTAIDNALGWSSPDEWQDIPAGTEMRWQGQDIVIQQTIDADELRESFRQRFRMAVLLNPDFNEALYNSYYGRFFGDLDWEPPQPPPETELVNALTSERPSEFNVIDGDTVVVHNDQGHPFYFRLLGINAPERGQDGYAEATRGLTDLLRNADRITVGMFQPEVYGTTQSFREQGPSGVVVDRDRIYAWLYVDGVPIYDPTVFTATNVRGQAVGGTVPDFQAMLARGAP